ncbi:unnamed protein product [Vicia faba]|uniref:Reverse transcriptase n=1 Tax=Vicia faba TaxID=3906 RepID=A0AAV0ZBR3_VICFA|nr:unnamed protein product [Vicia faba]
MLRSEECMEIREHKGLCRIARKYFEGLFTTTWNNHEPMLSLIQPIVSTKDNRRLLRPVFEDEFHAALCDMYPNKSPRSDRFNPVIYQNFWELCGDDIWQTATKWLTRGYFPQSITDINICLIPKNNKPQNMKDYRPISLCNMVYKIVSKVLANRMKILLDKCVMEEQSANIYIFINKSPHIMSSIFDIIAQVVLIDNNTVTVLLRTILVDVVTSFEILLEIFY